MTGAPRFRVRPATRDDLDAVLEIEAASFSTPWSRRTFEALLDRPTVHFRVLEAPAPGEAEGVEARASGEAVGEPAGGPAGEAPGESACTRVQGHGILWWSGPEAEVANVAVHPDLRGKGAGAVLLDHLLAEAGIRGVETVFLEVRESNAPARALYRSRGFQEVGRRPRYYRRPVEDALVLALAMGAEPGAGSATPESPPSDAAPQPEPATP